MVLSPNFSAGLLILVKEAWRQCRETFGEGNVVIVSNMAGTSHDAGQLEVGR